MKCYFVALVGLLGGLVARAAERPNVLLILADDMGYAVPTANGGDAKRVATPNLDRIALEGARFTEAYVTCSVCSPSRAGILSGQYPQRFGYYANKDAHAGGVPGDIAMMPRFLKEAGYTTAMVGKWHLGTKQPGQHPLEKGFDSYFGFDEAQTDYFKSPILFDGRTKVKEHDYLTEAFSDRAVKLINESGPQPFFLYLAYNAVHGPNHAPKETIAKFAHLPAKEAIQAAMVAELDEGIGRVLDALADTGKAENTLIFFLSDNGGLPTWWEDSHGGLRGYKRSAFDGGNKTPLFVRWPTRIPPAQVRGQPVIALDILPTALDAAGISSQDGLTLDGVSLMPALVSATDPKDERCLFWAGSHFDDRYTDQPGYNHADPPPAWAVRRGPWKLVHIIEEGDPMLFNVVDDPGESKDLISQHPEKARELTKAFADWFVISGHPIGWKREYYEALKGIK